MRLETAATLGALKVRAFDAIPALIAGLKDASPRVAAACADALLLFGKQSIQPLVDHARRSDPPDASRAFAAIARFGPDALKAAVEALGEERLRIGAMECLGAIGDGEAQDALFPFLEDGDARCRLAAASAIGRCGPAEPGIVAKLLQVADGDDDSAVRAAAIEAAGRLGGAEARDRLAGMRPEAPAPLRLALSLALWRLGGALEVEALRAALAASGPASAPDALRALDAVAEMGAEGRALAPQVLTRLDDPLPEVRAAAATAAGELLRAGGALFLERAERIRKSRNEKLRAAIDLGLRWLAAHQDPETGGIPAQEFARFDPPGDLCDGAGKRVFDVGVSGLALLAHLGAGRTPAGSEEARRLVRFLLAAQGARGIFGPPDSVHYMANHALATIALAEAQVLSPDPAILRSIRSAARWIESCRNPGAAWRYAPRDGENDTHMTCWLVWALRQADLASVRVDPFAFEGAADYVSRMTDPDWGNTGYNTQGGAPARPTGLAERFPPENSESMTSAGLWILSLCGPAAEARVRNRPQAKLAARVTPDWRPGSGRIDLIYWLFGSHALAQTDDPSAAKWLAALEAALLAGQRPASAGAKAGSWDPIDPWGPDGGRVYSTATALLCLETAWRYPKGFLRPVPAASDVAPLLERLVKAERDPDARAAEAARRALERARRLR